MRVRFTYIVLALSTVFLLSGCGNEPKPLPTKFLKFIGVWERGSFGDNDYVYTQITADGLIASSRYSKVGNNTTCVTIQPIPITEISETLIHASAYWVFNFDYVIEQAPALVDGKMQMQIDGRTLYKTGNGGAGFRYVFNCEDGKLLRR